MVCCTISGGWLNISPVFQNDAQQAFQLAALGVVFATLASGLRGARRIGKVPEQQYHQNGYGLMHLLFPSSGDSSAWTFSLSDSRLFSRCQIASAAA